MPSSKLKNCSDFTITALSLRKRTIKILKVTPLAVPLKIRLQSRCDVGSGHHPPLSDLIFHWLLKAQVLHSE